MNSIDFKQAKEISYRIVPLCEMLPTKKVCRVIETSYCVLLFLLPQIIVQACKGQSTKAFKSKLSIAFEEWMNHYSGWRLFQTLNW